LISERPLSPESARAFEDRLRRNPQYDYARRLAQLAPLRLLACPQMFDVIEQVMRSRGVRLGDVKPTALRPDDSWLSLFEELAD
jgi:hypothetical protein